MSTEHEQRVEQLRLAVQAGTYRLDTAALADAMLRYFEQILARE